MKTPSEYSFVSEQKLLSYEEAQSLLRVTAKAAASAGSIRSRRIAIMQAMAELTDSNCWLWTLLPPVKPGEKPIAVDVLHGGFNDDQLGYYFQAVEHPQMAQLNAPFIYEVLSSGLQETALRQDIDKEGVFPTLEVYELWKKANIAPLVLSARALEGGYISIACFYRHFDSELYTKRDEGLIQALFESQDWFHHEDSNDHLVKPQQLTPRERTILNLLINGSTRKEIAANLGISVNTVSSYIKDIYRLYDVHSQAELLKFFRDQ